MKTMMIDGFIIVLLGIVTLPGFTSSSDWNSPAYVFREPGKLSVLLVIKNSVTGVADPYVKSQIAKLAGISGELHYDPNVYHSPRIKTSHYAPDVKASGILIEPGVYRFVVYTSPIGLLPQWPIPEASDPAESAAAEFLFSFDSANPHEGQFTWENCQAAIMKDTSTPPQRCRQTYQSNPPTYPAFSLAPVVIRNDAKDWFLYE